MLSRVVGSSRRLGQLTVRHAPHRGALREFSSKLPGWESWGQANVRIGEVDGLKASNGRSRRSRIGCGTGCMVFDRRKMSGLAKMQGGGRNRMIERGRHLVGRRMFSSSSKLPAELLQVVEYLQSSKGLSETESLEVVKALRSADAGASAKSLITMVDSIGESGLLALVAAVGHDIEVKEARSTLADCKVTVHVPKERHSFELRGKHGDSLFDLVQEGSELSEFLECACGGKMMCSTCHVYVDSESFHIMGPPEEAEQDMIDLAYEPSDTSRLGCQIKLNCDLPALEVTIPEDSNNFFN